jgi:predicted phage terminase large subunit-like protein
MTSPKINIQKVDPQELLDRMDKEMCERSLHEFVKRAWKEVEPGQPMLDNWHLPFICEHLEAITDGAQVDGKPYNRLLINIPPGGMKSLLLNVFWPAWEWGPASLPHMRYLCASHNIDLVERDSIRMRRLVTTQWYQKHWGDLVELTGDQNSKTVFENTRSGWRRAVAAGADTGHRADRVLIDDALSVKNANSDSTRESVNLWFRESVPTRLNSPRKSAIVVIMQRLHEADLSGMILDKKLGYDHIMIPMRYDPDRAHPTMLGYKDPRTEAGQLYFPTRFPLDVVEREERIMGPYATAGQMQQSPVPRGGGVIKDADWVLWDRPEFPALDFIVASIDTAYGLKQENDPSAMTVWGVFSGDTRNQATRLVDRYGHPKEMPETSHADAAPRVILMYAWAERLSLSDLVVKVASCCKKLKVDRLLVEAKASGISVAQEMRRLYGHEPWAVHLINPGNQDKLARLYSVQPLFAEGMVYAPDKEWAEMVIRQVASFPKALHDDLTDTTSQAIRHLRDCGLLTRSDERLAEMNEEVQYGRTRPLEPLYPG